MTDRGIATNRQNPGPVRIPAKGKEHDRETPRWRGYWSPCRIWSVYGGCRRRRRLIHMVQSVCSGRIRVAAGIDAVFRVKTKRGTRSPQRLGAATNDRVGLGLSRTPIRGRPACGPMARITGSTQIRSPEDRCGRTTIIETLLEIRGIVEVDKDPLSLTSPARGEGLLFPSLDGRGKGRVKLPALINAWHYSTRDEAGSDDKSSRLEKHSNHSSTEKK